MQYSQLHHSMANVKIYKYLPHNFTPAVLTLYVTISNFLPQERRLWSRSSIFAITSFDCKCQNLQISPTNFCASSYSFRVNTILNLLPSKSRSRSRSAITQLHHSITNKTNLHMFSPYFELIHAVSELIFL